MVLLLYDAIVLPLGAFELPESGFLITMEFLSLCFWTLDIVGTFLVGYYEAGVEIKDPVKIAYRYLRQFFLFDVVVTGSSWVLSLLVEGSKTPNVQLLRLLRFARVFRLLRLLKLQRLLSLVHDNVNSEYTSIVLNFIQLMVAVLMLSHFAAGFWFFIGVSGPPGQNWVASAELEPESISLQYLVSFRFMLCTFLFEAVVDPMNALENLYLTSLVLFGVAVVSYILSRITSLMVELDAMNADVSRDFWKLRRFCAQRNVAPELKRRVVRYLESVCEERRNRVDEGDIRMLSWLTKDLADQLRFAAHGEHFKVHPLFDNITRRFQVTLHRICGTACDEMSLAIEDPLFFTGEVASKMFMVIRGVIAYCMRNGLRKDKRKKGGRATDWKGSGRLIRVGGSTESAEDWLCEAALWTSSWSHRGDAFAEQDCLIVSVDAERFGEVLLSSPSHIIRQTGKAYAEEFVRQINEKQANGVAMSDITDHLIVENAMAIASLHQARLSELNHH